MVTRFPEACSGLRVLLRGLPPAVYHSITHTNLQRSGCLHCGICPHSTNDCPILGSAAEERAAKLYRRWAALIGEELLVFSRSSSTHAYAEGARGRLSSRNDLPKHPPRRAKVAAAIKETSVIPVRKPPSISEPILPEPAGVTTNNAPTQISRPKTTSTPPPADRRMPTQQRQQPLSSLSAQPKSKAGTDPELAPDAKAARAPMPQAKMAAASSQKGAVSGTPRVLSRGQPLAASNGIQGEAAISQDMQNLPPDVEWHNDNVHLDDAILLASLARLSQDVEMMQTRLTGYRRSREFTPSSAQPNRNKFVCVEPSPPRPLDFTADATEALSSSSTVHVTPPAEYETWDLDRYIQARHFSARHRFWQVASEAAKQRMVLALYGQPSGTPATIQARENGWIPI